MTVSCHSNAVLIVPVLFSIVLQARQVCGFCPFDPQLQLASAKRSIKHTNKVLFPPAASVSMYPQQEPEGTEYNEANMQSLEEIYNRIKQDGKSIPKVSTTTFLLALGIGVPIWISIILPMTVAYQVGKALLPSSKKNTAISPVDIDSSDFFSDSIPLMDRKYDLVLLGATGFTGKLAALYLCQQYGGKLH